MTFHATADFPAGNGIILCTDLSGTTPEVQFAAAPTGGPEAVGFHIAIDPGESAPTAIRCVLRFFENLLGNRPGQAPNGFRPVYRTAQRDWERVASIEQITLPDGQLAMAWLVPGNEGRVEVALSYPYGEGEWQRLQNDMEGRWRSDAIGLTEQGRAIPRIANRLGAPEGREPGIYCLARQHAAETPGSWVLEGFLRRMDQAGEAAPLVWAVPFADPDGVAQGWGGKDRFPFDFNRSWGSKLFPPDLKSAMGTHPLRHEVKCLQHDMLRWIGRCAPALVLDFHAPTVCNGGGIYCYLRDIDEAGRPDAAHAIWADAFEQAIDERLRARRFVHSGRYPGRWNTARVGDFVNQALKLPEVTFEIPYACVREHCFTRDDYLAAGGCIAAAVLDMSAPEP